MTDESFELQTMTLVYQSRHAGHMMSCVRILSCQFHPMMTNQTCCFATVLVSSAVALWLSLLVHVKLLGSQVPHFAPSRHDEINTSPSHEFIYLLLISTSYSRRPQGWPTSSLHLGLRRLRCPRVGKPSGMINTRNGTSASPRTIRLLTFHLH